jgi:hypothetical protein
MILLSEGTRIAIQNMTWGGAQGFQTPIEPETFTVPGFGVYGNAHSERNLTCESDLVNHVKMMILRRGIRRRVLL